MDRVLLVNDDVQLCRLLAERLATEGFTIEMVHDGSRGLERALSIEYARVVLNIIVGFLEQGIIADALSETGRMSDSPCCRQSATDS